MKPIEEIEPLWQVPSMDLAEGEDGPVAAFDIFYNASNMACDPTHIALLRGAMLTKASRNGEIPVGAIPLDVFDRISFEMAEVLADRCARVVAEVRKYMARHADNTLAVIRLSWLCDRVRERPWFRQPIPEWEIPKERVSAQFMIYIDVRHQFSTDLLNIAQELEEAKSTNGVFLAHGQGFKERISWNDNAALLAYLFHQLTEQGYITPPQRNGASNWTAFARTIFAAFDMQKENGDPVTITSFIQAMKKTGDVTENKRGPHAFKIYRRE